MSLVPKSKDTKSMLDNFLDDNNDSECDIYEKNGKYHVELDVPGLKDDDIKVEYKDGYMSITASKKISKEEKSDDYIRKQREESSMFRQFYLGDIYEDSISVNVKNGVLKISADKKESNEE